MTFRYFKWLQLSVVTFAFTLATGCVSTNNNDQLQATGAAAVVKPDIDPYYYLPVGRVELEISRSLMCEKKSKAVSFNWKVTGGVKSIADTDHPIPLQLSELDHFGRETVVKITFSEDGRLAGLNLDSKDQIGPAISGILSGIVKIGLAVAGLKGLGMGDEPNACPDNLVAVFDSARGMQSKIEEAEKARGEEAGRLANITPGSPDHVAITKKLAEFDKNIGNYRNEQVKLLTPYTYVEKIAYIPKARDSNPKGSSKTAIKSIPQDVLKRWGLHTSIAKITEGRIIVTPSASWGNVPSQIDGTKLYVRTPGTARITVEARSVLDPQAASSEKCKEVEGENRVPVFTETVPLPQAGRLLAINLDADLFRDKIVNVDFHTSGTLKTVGTTDKSGASAVTNVVAGVQQSVDAYATYRVAREAKNSELAEINDENALLEAQIKYLESKAKLAELEAEQSVTEAD